MRVEYRLGGVAAGDSVRVTLLDYGLGVPPEIRIGEAGTAGTLRVAQGAARRARIPVETAPDGGGRVVVGYRVPVPARADVPVVVRVPVLTVDGPAEANRPALFRADLRVPTEWKVVEAFPSGLVAGAGAGVLRAELGVVPSVVTLRVRTDGRRAASLPLALNVLAAACVALVSIAGWRQLAPRAS